MSSPEAVFQREKPTKIAFDRGQFGAVRRKGERIYFHKWSIFFALKSRIRAQQTDQLPALHVPQTDHSPTASRCQDFPIV